MIFGCFGFFAIFEPPQNASTRIFEISVRNAQFSAQTEPMSLPPLFSLFDELLIEIISNLCPADIYACRCTCRRLNGVIINSHLIQYTLRTALSGVFDSLEPGLSLPERLDALERWETAWMEMDLRQPNVIIGAPVSTESVPLPPIFLSGQYFIMYHERIGASAFYSFLNIHARSSHTDSPRWTTIKIGTRTVAFAFASELNLTVAISYVNLLVSAHSFSSGTLVNLYHVGYRTTLTTR